MGGMSNKPHLRASQVVHHNPYFVVRHDALTWPNGHQGDYYVVEKRGFVMVVALRDGALCLVRQHRYTLDAVTLELPKGSVEAGETPEISAWRELREEAGLGARGLRLLGVLAVAVGFCRNPCHVYLAEDPVTLEGTPERDPTEDDLTAVWVPLAEWRARIAAGEIVDADTLAAWALVQAQP